MKQNTKTNMIAKYLHSRGWKPYIGEKRIIQKPMWIKGVLIEDTKRAYELQKEIDEEQQKQQG